MVDPHSFLPLAPARFHALVALSGGDMHGYAIMRAVEESSRGEVKMGPATLYGTIKKLVEAGLVEEVDHPGTAEDERRRYYRLTRLGRRVCLAESDRLAELVRVARTNLGPVPA
jgi:DNA-binding PadR family transcriptional regulator